MADDSLVYQLDTVSSSVMPKPVTLASAATIAPTCFLTFVTGTVGVGTITPPIAGAHLLAFIFTNGSPGATITTGNIILATTVVQNKMLLMAYDPVSNKYYPSY
jgi:hypothetical protein